MLTRCLYGPYGGGSPIRRFNNLFRPSTTTTLFSIQPHRYQSGENNDSEDLSSNKTKAIKKVTPRMRRIKANIEVYNARKTNPLLTKIQPLKLPVSFDPKTSPYEDIDRAIKAYERSGQCRSIHNLCSVLNERDNGVLLGMNGAKLLRSMIVAELKLNRNDFAVEMLEQFGERYFKESLICKEVANSENQYSSELYSFMQSLCQYGNMEAATVMLLKFDLIGDKYLQQLIKSREYDDKFEENIVTSVSAKLFSMSSQLANSGKAVDGKKSDNISFESKANDIEGRKDGIGECFTPWYEYLPSLYATLAEGYIRCNQLSEASIMLKKWRLDAHQSAIALQQDMMQKQHDSTAAKVPKRPLQRLFRVSSEMSSSLMKTAIELQYKPIVFDVLETLHVIGSSPDEMTNEKMVHAMIQTITFRTGAVSLDTLPSESVPEAAVIGRSNVGKSSLINYVVGRKAMAFTSKTPGKTQQFNYFSVNEESKWSPKGHFYLVDLPGVGYAKVPKPLREQWRGFMEKYLTERKTLKVVFHLIDSRHGPVAQDEVVMAMMAKIPKHVKYVIVLTKVDKKNSKHVLDANIKSIKSKLVECGQFPPHENIPILLTSSLSRRGRNDVWRYLRHAADHPDVVDETDPEK